MVRCCMYGLSVLFCLIISSCSPNFTKLQETLENQGFNEFTIEQRLFVALLKIKGINNRELSAKHSERWPDKTHPCISNLQLDSHSQNVKKLVSYFLEILVMLLILKTVICNHNLNISGKLQDLGHFETLHGARFLKHPLIKFLDAFGAEKLPNKKCNVKFGTPCRFWMLTQNVTKILMLQNISKCLCHYFLYFVILLLEIRCTV